MQQRHLEERASVKEVGIVGLRLAKQAFHLRAASADDGLVLRRKLSRVRVLSFFSELPRCAGAMEAYQTADYWAREIGELGHEVRLLPSAYVKPFVKRQENDAADAEAILEAAIAPRSRLLCRERRSSMALPLSFGRGVHLGRDIKGAGRDRRRVRGENKSSTNAQYRKLEILDFGYPHGSSANS